MLYPSSESILLAIIKSIAFIKEMWKSELDIVIVVLQSQSEISVEVRIKIKGSQ